MTPRPSRRLGARTILAAAVIAASGLSSRAAAQAERGATFADATGFVWGAGIAEVGVLLSLGLSEMANENRSRILGMGALVSLSAAIIGGIALQVAEAPPDVPFVVHEASLGFLSAGLLGSALPEAFGDGGDDDEAGFAGGIAFGWGAGSYSFVRREALLRNPDTTLATHMLAWAPIGSMLLFTLAAGVADADDEVVRAAGGIGGLIGMLTGFVVAEVILANEEADAMAMPLLGAAMEW